MSIKTKEEAVELIIKSLPYPNQIHHWSFREEEAIRFTWRSARYRLSLSGMIEEESKPSGFLKGSDKAILIEKLIGEH